MINLNEINERRERVKKLAQYIDVCNINATQTIVITQRLKELNKKAKKLSYEEFMAEAGEIRNLTTLNITRR